MQELERLRTIDQLTLRSKGSIPNVRKVDPGERHDGRQQAGHSQSAIIERQRDDNGIRCSGSSHLERKFVTLVDSSNLCSGESSWLMQVSEAGRSRR